MSSTNKTTNYELSQFLGTDKPAWLSDYNGDMGKIDAQMKLNADAATAAQGTASAASTAVGTLANLTTDAKTSAVAAINEVDGHADAAQETASSALSTAGANADAISALTTYLNLNTFNTYSQSQMSVVSGGGSLTGVPLLTVAKNSDGSLCKIYGQVSVANATGSTLGRIKLNADTGLRPSEQIVVTNTGISWDGQNVANTNLYINTDGTIEISGNHTLTTYDFRMFACVIFVKNFGDQPE